MVYLFEIYEFLKCLYCDTNRYANVHHLSWELLHFRRTQNINYRAINLFTRFPKN